ncbi:MAG: S8 family serine peptidase [Candidatus Rokubacteria bacterium]|nr:S8 family serine peptidase [Candidatus Rokubacteria bacterium]
MTRILLILIALLAFVPRPAAAQDPVGSDDVIVIFRGDLNPAQREAVIRQAGAVPGRHFKSVRASSARLAAPGARQALEGHPDVLEVVPDRPVEAHAKPAGGGGGGAGQVTPAGVQRIGAAPGALAFAGAGVGVAVVDTGIDFNHADLQPVEPECFTAFAACQDDNGHGTHVGGIVAARHNTIDVVGVAPAAGLYAVKVLNHRGRGSDSSIIAGLDWVAQHAATLAPPIRVVNMSLGRQGTVGDNPALHGAVQALTGAGITVVVSAGNDPNRDVSQQIPAAYAEVIAVASTTALGGTSACNVVPAGIPQDTASYFTTDGVGVTVSAPGEDRENVGKNCFLSSVGILSTKLGGGTTRLSGTSMSAPHVTGVATLLWEQFETIAPETIRGKLTAGAALVGTAPLNSPSSAYTFDGEREGVLSAPGALAAP